MTVDQPREPAVLRPPPDLSETACIVIQIIGAFVLGMLLSQKMGLVPVIWPANGVWLGILLTSLPASRPSYLAVGVLANLAAAYLIGIPVESCIRLALVNLAETSLALHLMPRYLGGGQDLSHAGGLWRFGLFAVLLAPAAAAMLNAALWAVFTGDVPLAWLTASWLAHALGIMTITPFVMALRSRAFARVIGLQRAGHAIFAVALLLGVTVLVFSQRRYPMLFLIFPPLVFVVLVAGFPGGSLAVFLATLVSVGFTVADMGPKQLIGIATNQERFIIIQVFAASAAVLVLVLSAILAERDRARQQLQDTRDRLAHLAATDALTGLANRRRLDEVLDAECRHAKSKGTPVSLLLLDIDHFKAFNDHYGHQAGDECLRAVADVMLPFARRPGNLAARYGGEELALILPAATEAVAVKAANALRKAIEALELPQIGSAEGRKRVTASIGVATADIRNPAYNPGVLMRAADEMLYEAKRTGRNQVMARVIAAARPVAMPPVREARRAAAAQAYTEAVATHPSAVLDDIAALAASALGTPIGLVSLIGKDRQVFIGRHGLALRSTARGDSFCTHVIGGDSPMVVPDAAADPRFQSNPFVTGEPGIRFYAGAPLVAPGDQERLGSVCVLDREVHAPLSEAQQVQLSALAALAMLHLDHLVPDKALPAG